MDISSTIQTLNWLAVIVATASSFMIGGVWYGPFFGKLWMMENGFNDDDLKKRNMPKVFTLAIVLSFIAAVNLAMFLGPQADIAFGAMAGFFTGFGWVATMVGTHYLFENKSLKLFLVNAGFSTVALTVMGIIIGAFN